MKIDPQKAKVVSTWEHTAPLIDCRFDPSGRFVFATSEDRRVVRFDAASGKTTLYEGHDSWSCRVACLADTDTVVSCGFDDLLIWWPLSDDQPRPIRRVVAHDGWIRALEPSPDGKLLATGGNDRVIKLWDAATGSLRQTLDGHERAVYSLAFLSGSTTSLLSGDLLGRVIHWDISTGKQIGKFDAKDLHSYNKGQRVDFGGARSMTISADAKQLVVAGLHKATNPLGAVSEPLLLRFDLASGKLVEKHVGEGVRGTAWRAVLHDDGTLIACSGGSGGGFLLFWNEGHEKPAHKLKLPNTARGMDLHPDGRQIATAHHDRRLRVSQVE